MGYRYGFAGAGKMAVAMIEGMLSKGLCSKGDIIASCRTEETRDRVHSATGVEVVTDSSLVFEQSDFIVLGVKPAQIGPLLESHPSADSPGKLIVSIAAGVTIGELESFVPESRVVRVMPNMCCMVREGASGYTLGTRATAEDAEAVKRVLDAVGVSIEIPERDIDAVTGLSGSSPAYMFMVIEAMADAGVLLGLSREVSIRLAAQSMLGSARTVLETGLHPGVLKDGVCSPGGTTIEGVRVMEESGVRAAIIDAIKASADKSRRMGRPPSSAE